MRTWKLAVGAAAVALLATGCGWGQFGYSSARTSFNDGETGLTLDKLDSLDFPWFKHPGTGDRAQAPIIDGNRVFVARNNEIVAYDATTGDVQWNYAVPNARWDQVTLEAPAFVSGRILAVFSRRTPGTAPYGLISVDPATGEGTEIDLDAGAPVGTPAAYAGVGYVTTQATISNPSTVESTASAWRGAITDTRVGASSPMVLNGLVYVSSGYTVDAFDPANCTPGIVAGTCKPLWSRDLELSGEANPGQARMPIGLGTDAIAVRTLYGNVWVLDAATGAPRWRTSGLTGSSAVSSARGVLYVMSGGNLLAYNAAGCGTATCTPVWTGLGAGGDAAPVIAADVVYTSDQGILRAFNANGCGAATCVDVWKAQIDGRADITWAIVYQSRIYVASDTGTVAALKIYP